MLRPPGHGGNGDNAAHPVTVEKPARVRAQPLLPSSLERLTLHRRFDESFSRQYLPRMVQVSVARATTMTTMARVNQSMSNNA